MRISDWSSDVCSSDLAHLIYRHAVHSPPFRVPHGRLPLWRRLLPEPWPPHACMGWFFVERMPGLKWVSSRGNPQSSLCRLSNISFRYFTCQTGRHIQKNTLHSSQTRRRQSKCPVTVTGPLTLALDGMDVEAWAAVALKQ